jgi:hypothetical protein
MAPLRASSFSSPSLFKVVLNRTCQKKKKSDYAVPRWAPRSRALNDRTQDRWHIRPGDLQVGPRQGLRHRHHHCEALSSRGVPRRRPFACVSFLVHPRSTDLVLPLLADLTPEEVEAIDKAGEKGPPTPVRAGVRVVALVWLSRVRNAAVHATLGALATLTIIMLLCHCFGW